MFSYKNLAVFSVLTFCGVLSVSQAKAAPLPLPELVNVQSDQIFSPPGFDSNDVAQVVIHGRYMNTCYHSAAPEVVFDSESRTFTITPKAYLRSGCWCAPVLGDFTQAIELGILEPGKYRVVEFDGRGQLLHEASLSIAPSEATSADDFLYAPVKSVQLVQNGVDRELLLSGAFTSDCMELQNIKTQQRTAHVIEVLPLVSFKAGTNCNNSTLRPFEVRVKLPATEPGSTLFHVRSLNGQAINLVEAL